MVINGLPAGVVVESIESAWRKVLSPLERKMCHFLYTDDLRVRIHLTRWPCSVVVPSAKSRNIGGPTTSPLPVSRRRNKSKVAITWRCVRVCKKNERYSICATAQAGWMVRSKVEGDRAKVYSKIRGTVSGWGVL